MAKREVLGGETGARSEEKPNEAYKQLDHPCKLGGILAMTINCKSLYNQRYGVFARDNLARNRFYDVTQGRWIERDPAGYVDGQSLYEFVASRPTYWSDSFGLCQDDKGDPCELPKPRDIPVDWPEDFPPDPALPNPGKGNAAHKECCNKAAKRIKKERPRRDPMARVVCCGGKKIMCFFHPAREMFPGGGLRRGGPLIQQGIAEGQRLVDACTLDHERRHGGQGSSQCQKDGKNRPDGSVPYFPDAPEDAPETSPLGKCEHCKIIRENLRCLDRAKKACDKLKTSQERQGCHSVVDPARSAMNRMRIRRGCKKQEPGAPGPS